MRHHVAFEQSGVARQHDSAFGGRRRGKMRVIAIAFVRGIETEQPQVPGEPAEVDVHKESWFPERLGSHARDRTDVERLEHG